MVRHGNNGCMTTAGIIAPALAALLLAPALALADLPPPAPPPRMPLPALALSTPDDGPERLEYDPEKPIPAGYELRALTRSGLLVAGTTMFGAGYVGGVAFAFGNDVPSAGLSFIPVVGPVLGPALSGKFDVAAGLVTIPALVAEAAGVTFALVALLVPKKVLFRPGAAWTIAPLRLRGGGYGLSTVGVF
jgi:hypothetical protein